MKCVEVLKMKITFEAEKIRLKYQNEQASGQKAVEHFFSLAYRIKNKNSQHFSSYLPVLPVSPVVIMCCEIQQVPRLVKWLAEVC